MNKKEESARIRKIESGILESYFAGLPYGEPRRIKATIVKKLCVGKDDDEQRTIKKSISNWLQGQCRIPFAAKLVINEVVGYPLLRPYDNYREVVSRMDDATLLDHIRRNIPWAKRMATFYNISYAEFMLYLDEFTKARLARHRAAPDVEDCISHLNNWLKSYKKLEAASTAMQPDIYAVDPS